MTKKKPEGRRFHSREAGIDIWYNARMEPYPFRWRYTGRSLSEPITSWLGWLDYDWEEIGVRPTRTAPNSTDISGTDPLVSGNENG